MCITEKSCPWLVSTKKDDELECVDGSTCNARNSPLKWACCTEKKLKRGKCPKNYPEMCANQACGHEKSDYCCEREDSCVNKYGGPRACDENGNDYPCYILP